MIHMIDIYIDDTLKLCILNQLLIRSSPILCRGDVVPRGDYASLGPGVDNKVAK